MRTDPALHYLDNAATTLVDPAVADAIHKALLTALEAGLRELQHI